MADRDTADVRREAETAAAGAASPGCLQWHGGSSATRSNYVLLDIGNERYPLYAHLQPGLPVRVGDRVREGDVLGLVGNSGNSDGTHLHFQAVDRPSAHGGEGVPYVLDRFEVIGRRFGMDAELWEPEVRELEMPMEGTLLRLRAR